MSAWQAAHPAEQVWPASVYMAIRAASTERKSNEDKAVRASMGTNEQAKTKLDYSEYK